MITRIARLVRKEDYKMIASIWRVNFYFFSFYVCFKRPDLYLVTMDVEKALIAVLS